jgi:presenilin-like A22 family membrane protease
VNVFVRGRQQTDKRMNKNTRLNPVYLSIVFFIFAQLLTFAIVTRENAFLENNQIYVPPQSPPEAIVLWPTPPAETPGVPPRPEPPFWTALGPILIYFFAVILMLGAVLFLIPMSWLKLILRFVFAFLFSWGIFVILVFWVPLVVALAICVLIGLAWLLVPRVWLHDLVMLFTMVSIGAVFGRIISPWTAMILLLVLSIYDFVAVRFGYMMWMANKLSDSNTLPAFILPRFLSEWNASLKQAELSKLSETKPDERDYSILGGGDIGFPLLMVSSAYFGYGLQASLLVGIFSLAGLIAAYWIQSAFLKGKPMPALPPIAVLCLIGLLIVR